MLALLLTWSCHLVDKDFTTHKKIIQSQSLPMLAIDVVGINGVVVLALLD
jgi:hypothetical protein